MSNTIHITIDGNQVELITESHLKRFPTETRNNSRRAYDWIIFPQDPREILPTIGSGSCEWQCCGYQEYTNDLPLNLMSGHVAYQIRNDLQNFLLDPHLFLEHLDTGLTFVISIIHR